VLDEEAVEFRVLSEHLLDEDERPLIREPFVDVPDQAMAVQGPDELEREHQEDHGRVVDAHAGVQVRALQLVRPVEFRLRELPSCLLDHLG
jgi:hypothetical protein